MNNIHFVFQLGGLVIFALLAFLLRNHIRRFSLTTSILLLIGIALLHALPAFGSGVSYMLFAALSAACLIVAWALLRLIGRTQLAAVSGACIFGCSTWLPLYLIGGNTMPVAIIIVVGAFAWFASLCIDRMQRFMGLQDTLAQILLATLLTIALLDLMHITTATLQYGL